MTLKPRVTTRLSFTTQQSSRSIIQNCTWVELYTYMCRVTFLTFILVEEIFKALKYMLMVL